MTAMRICMDRICAVRRDRHVKFKLPKLATPADAMLAVSAIAEGVASAEISPAEAGELTKLIDAFTRVNEAMGVEARLAAVEAAIDAGGNFLGFIVKSCG
jgi:hypothetical protein